MPATEIITIVNNSGKVISTGKQLVNIFKEAQAAYRDKKDAVKAGRAGIQRAKTFDVTPRGPADPYYNDYHYGRHDGEIDNAYDRRSLGDGSGRGRSHDEDDDGRSHASTRYSRRSRRSHQPRSSSRDRPALTESNLKSHSEVSATTPSKAYRSPYAETAPRDMQLSRPTLAAPPPPAESIHQSTPAPASRAVVPARDRRQLVHRPRSDPSLSKKKSIDMDLAYGDLPPDLASYHDLEPAHQEERDAGPEDPQEVEALGLLDRIEDFLEEAQCMHHTASSMIENLQRNPEAAAAVALSLAELSALIGKMSPGFLAFLKGGSPAVFALLASPQFLIGASVAVGVTVVMFGGWKIVKRIADAGAKTLEAPIEMRAAPQSALAAAAVDRKALPTSGPIPASAASYDEAVVLDDVEELSSIETWRRGIVPFGEDESAADIELMSREAERALREMCRDDEVDPSDSVSQAGRSVYSYRSRRSHRSHRSSSSRHHSHKEEDHKVPDRKSSRKDSKNEDGAESEAASERSRRSHRSSRSHREGSTVSRSSKHSSKTALRAIDEGSKEDDGDSVSGKPKEKKRDMIKQLFKMKKDKEDRQKSVAAVSVLV
ncbi:WD repeat containing protein pop1 [Madurella fahalii]|uniref:WD repeat containing protein pop1 n=1 Tax=Madurella fahalii TaxID=1157608 RepID=A0ABQ0GCC5_9PEZI